MSVLLPSPTSLPLPLQPVSASRARAIELWLLTAFLFSLLIVGRITGHSTSNQLNKLPTSTSLLRNTLPVRPIGKPGSPVPYFQPTALYLPTLTTLQ